jgi:hypothetical protein
MQVETAAERKERAHRARDDGLVTVVPIIERTGGRFADLIDSGPAPDERAEIRLAETIGRPFGAPAFIDQLE